MHLDDRGLHLQDHRLIRGATFWQEEQVYMSRWNQGTSLHQNYWLFEEWKQSGLPATLANLGKPEKWLDFCCQRIWENVVNIGEKVGEFDACDLGEPPWCQWSFWVLLVVAKLKLLVMEFWANNVMPPPWMWGGLQQAPSVMTVAPIMAIALTSGSPIICGDNTEPHLASLDRLHPHKPGSQHTVSEALANEVPALKSPQVAPPW